MTIKDSGERRNFDTGAVRDVAEGKGRCDLLPLDTIASIGFDDAEWHAVFSHLETFVRTGSIAPVEAIIKGFSKSVFGDLPTGILEVSKHFEEGCNKYGERNWEKGIPLHCYLDSAIRHFLKYKRGDNDERHDRAFIWNLLCMLWTYFNRPNCIDIPFEGIAIPTIGGQENE